MTTDLQEYINSLKANGAPIVVFGAGHLSEVAFLALERAGIRPTAAYDKLFCPPKFTHIMGTPIFHSDELLSMPRDTHILLTPRREFHMLRKKYRGAGFANVHNVLPLLDSVDVDKYAGERHDESIYQFSREHPIFDGGRILHEPAIVYKREMQIYRYMVKEFGTPGKLFLMDLLVMLGEQCTLRCRDCCADIQYYKKPKQFKLETIIESMDRLVSLVGCFRGITISGDEPFMYTALLDLLKYLHKAHNVTHINISTNSTILPPDAVFELLGEYGVELMLSDYGALAKKRVQIAEKCQQFGISYRENINERWGDVGGFVNRGYTREEVRDRYEKCIFRTSAFLVDGTLYQCYRAASTHRLGIVTPKDDEAIPLLPGVLGDKEIIARLDRLINMRYEEPVPLTACDYCNSANPKYQPTVAEVAAQVSGPLPLDYKDTPEWKASLLPPYGDDVIDGKRTDLWQ